MTESQNPPIFCQTCRLPHLIIEQKTLGENVYFYYCSKCTSHDAITFLRETVPGGLIQETGVLPGGLIQETGDLVLNFQNESLSDLERKFTKLSTETLELLMQAGNRELSQRRGKDFVCLLNELYQRNDWGKMDFITIQRQSGKVWMGLISPVQPQLRFTLCIDKGVDQKEAKKNVAKEALRMLNQMGYK